MQICICLRFSCLFQCLLQSLLKGKKRLYRTVNLPALGAIYTWPGPTSSLPNQREPPVVLVVSVGFQPVLCEGGKLFEFCDFSRFVFVKPTAFLSSSNPHSCLYTEWGKHPDIKSIIKINMVMSRGGFDPRPRVWRPWSAGRRRWHVFRRAGAGCRALDPLRGVPERVRLAGGDARPVPSPGPRGQLSAGAASSAWRRWRLWRLPPAQRSAARHLWCDQGENTCTVFPSAGRNAVLLQYFSFCMCKSNVNKEKSTVNDKLIDVFIVNTKLSLAGNNWIFTSQGEFGKWRPGWGREIH